MVAAEPFNASAVGGWLALRTAAYKHLADVVVVDQLPRTPSGKLLRRVLREATVQ